MTELINQIIINVNPSDYKGALSFAFAGCLAIIIIVAGVSRLTLDLGATGFGKLLFTLLSF